MNFPGFRVRQRNEGIIIICKCTRGNLIIEIACLSTDGDNGEPERLSVENSIPKIIAAAKLFASLSQLATVLQLPAIRGLKDNGVKTIKDKTILKFYTFLASNPPCSVP